MIIIEYYGERYDGKKLYKTYSDENYYIIQHPTEIEYQEAIDVENAPYTYTESERKIEPEEEIE